MKTSLQLFCLALVLSLPAGLAAEIAGLSFPLGPLQLFCGFIFAAVLLCLTSDYSDAARGSSLSRSQISHRKSAHALAA